GPRAWLTACMYVAALVPGFRPTSYWFRFWLTARPGRVCALANSCGSLEGANTSPAIRTVAWVVPVFTVMGLPTVRPLWARNAVFTATWPGPLGQWPLIRPKPIQEASPP